MKKLLFIISALIGFIACDDDDATIATQVNNANTTTITTTDVQHTMAKGADVSWVSEMEKAGKKFFNADGVETECFTLLKSLGINAIRLRVWVNPNDGWNSKNDVIQKAIRANQIGLRLMIDFHYSDTWADPSKQTKPAAWTNYSFEELKKAVSNHTSDVLSSLKMLNIEPEWVQIGNETGGGMLWDEGSTNYPAQYAALTNAGYDAAKAIFPNTKVIVHIQNGWYKATADYICKILKEYNGKYDIIGVSLYPESAQSESRGINLGITSWPICNKICFENLTSLSTTYDKDVMIVEFGYSWDKAIEAKNCLSDLIEQGSKTQRFLGIMYWEPECYADWNGYKMGAFDNFGKPTAALDAFK